MQLSLFPPSCPAPEFRRLDPAAILADPDQPREAFDPVAHETLVASVAALGVLEPLLVEELPGVSISHGD